jgi:hypothetical protein
MQYYLTENLIKLKIQTFTRQINLKESKPTTFVVTEAGNQASSAIFNDDALCLISLSHVIV